MKNTGKQLEYQKQQLTVITDELKNKLMFVEETNRATFASVSQIKRYSFFFKYP